MSQAQVVATAALRAGLTVGRQVGQTVRFGTPAGTTTTRIVGRMIDPSVGDLLINGLGEGARVPDSYFR
jgi:hypothetical protein